MTLQEKVFFVEIDSLDNENGCFANNQYFANFFGISKQRVSLVIQSLKKKGLITSKIIYKEGTQQILHRVLNICKIPYPTKVIDPTLQKFKDNNTISNTMNNTKEKEPQTPKRATLSPSQKLLISAIGRSQFNLVNQSDKAGALPREKKKLLIEYLTHRREIKKPLKTNRSVSAYCNKFDKYSVGEIRKVLDMTLDEGWTGLIWDKLEEKPKASKYDIEQQDYDPNEAGGGLAYAGE